MKLIVENKKALHDYEIEEKFEAGIKLTGAEMKSVRQRRADLRRSFVKIVKDEPLVFNLKIHKYPFAAKPDYDPKRARKLLLKKNQIKRLIGRDSQKGVVIVPLRLYFKGNVVKLEIGVGKKRKRYDKREILKRREDKRRTEKMIKEIGRL